MKIHLGYYRYFFCLKRINAKINDIVDIKDKKLDNPWKSLLAKKLNCKTTDFPANRLQQTGRGDIGRKSTLNRYTIYNMGNNWFDVIKPNYYNFKNLRYKIFLHNLMIEQTNVYFCIIKSKYYNFDYNDVFTDGIDFDENGEPQLIFEWINKQIVLDDIILVKKDDLRDLILDKLEVPTSYQYTFNKIEGNTLFFDNGTKLDLSSIVITDHKILVDSQNFNPNITFNKELETMAKELYDYWFVQFDFPGADNKPYKSSGYKMVYNPILKREIPEGWEAKSVLDVIEPIERGISYTSDDILLDTGIPMLNLACYDKQGEYRVGEFKFFSGKIFQKAYPFEMFIACTDMTQNADIIGRPIFAPTEYNEYVYSMDLAKITPKTISKMYLYYTLRTSFYHKYIKPFASGTNVKHLNIKGIEKYPIPIPNKDIQDKFEKIIKTIKEKQQECLKEIQKLTALRDELLPMLMNGQVSIK